MEGAGTGVGGGGAKASTWGGSPRLYIGNYRDPCDLWERLEADKDVGPGDDPALRGRPPGNRQRQRLSARLAKLTGARYGAARTETIRKQKNTEIKKKTSSL